MKLTTVCTVFVESDILSYLVQGKKIEDILGVHKAIATRTLSLAARVGLDPEVTFTGGIAQCGHGTGPGRAAGPQDQYKPGRASGRRHRRRDLAIEKAAAIGSAR